MTWQTNSNQTLFDLAIQLYGDVSFAVKLANDNNLEFSYLSETNDSINYNLSINNTNTLQTLLINNRKTLATGFRAATPPTPPIIQRSYNNDFSLDFD